MKKKKNWSFNLLVDNTHRFGTSAHATLLFSPIHTSQQIKMCARVINHLHKICFIYVDPKSMEWDVECHRSTFFSAIALNNIFFVNLI